MHRYIVRIHYGVMFEYSGGCNVLLRVHGWAELHILLL